MSALEGVAPVAAQHRENEPRCAAVVGHRVDEWGIHPVRCHQWRGLREVVTKGASLFYCAAPGHRVQVQGKARRS